MDSSSWVSCCDASHSSSSFAFKKKWNEVSLQTLRDGGGGNTSKWEDSMDSKGEVNVLLSFTSNRPMHVIRV